MKKHLAYYISLLIFLVLGIVLMISVSPDRFMQMIILIALSVLYAVIGIIHHLINHDLVFKIMIEYVLIAMLGISIALFIFNGGFGF